MVDAWDTPFTTQVHQLLALDRLRGATVLGGRDGGQRTVTDVRVVGDARHPHGGYAGCVILLDGRVLVNDNFVVDVVLRWMDDAGAPPLLVVSPTLDVSLSARRLADKLHIALGVVDDEILDLADALRDVVRAPERLLSRLVVEAVDRLARVSNTQPVDELLAVVGDVLQAEVTQLGLEGEVVQGPALDPPIPVRDLVVVPMRSVVDHTVRLVQPVLLAQGERPSFWLVVHSPSPTVAWEEAATRVLTLAASYVATRLVSSRLEQERDARSRLGALNAIIAINDRPSASLTAQIGTLGWKTDGWCTAVHLRVGGIGDQLLVLALTDMLSRYLTPILDGPVIERPDGWTTWSTQAAEPAASSFGQLVVAIRRALQDFVAEHPGLRVYAGIGHPYVGVLGLRKSLAEAEEASTIAQASGLRTAVQHIDELGVQRILVGWYTSSEFRDFARTLLRPVIDLDRDDELMPTLEVYLDNESSPTATADILGVHRNTVIKRIGRIKASLAVDLDDPDQRLAVQLACRVVNVSA